MYTQEQIDDEVYNIRDAFASAHNQGRDIGWKHGTASLRPA